MLGLLLLYNEESKAILTNCNPKTPQELLG